MVELVHKVYILKCFQLIKGEDFKSFEQGGSVLMVGRVGNTSNGLLLLFTDKVQVFLSSLVIDI